MLSKRIVFKRSIFVSISAICFTFLYGVVCQAEMMNACVKKNSGNMRLVSNLDQCLRSESPVSWNNVPQSEIDAQKEDLNKAKETIIQLQDQLNTLNQQLSSLENDKVDQVMGQVAVLETEQIPKVTQDISEIQVVHAETRQLVDSNEGLLRTVETDVQLTSDRVTTVNDELVKTTKDLASTTKDLASTTKDLASTTEDLASTTEDLASTVARVDSVQVLAEDRDLRIGVLEETAVSIVDFEEATSKVANLEDDLGTLQEEIVPVIEELQDVDAINKLISLAPYITVNEDVVNGALLPEVIFKGVNVHIRSGFGATNDGGIGLGNLIIGYNEGRENMDEGETKRTGSHNLVIGPYHNYESVGGLVAGCYNTVSGAYATVSGGEGNTAAGYAAAVSGGSGNTATEDYDLLP